MAKSKRPSNTKRPAKKRPSKPSGSAAEIAKLKKAVQSRDLVIKNLRTQGARAVDVGLQVSETEAACQTKVTELEAALAKAYADIAQLTAEKRAGEGQPPQ